MRHEGLNVDVSIKMYPSYSAALDAIVRGKNDFGRFGPANDALARERNKGIRLLAMEHKKNQKLPKRVGNDGQSSI